MPATKYRKKSKPIEGMRFQGSPEQLREVFDWVKGKNVCLFQSSYILSLEEQLDVIDASVAIRYDRPLLVIQARDDLRIFVGEGDYVLYYDDVFHVYPAQTVEENYEEVL